MTSHYSMCAYQRHTCVCSLSQEAVAGLWGDPASWCWSGPPPLASCHFWPLWDNLLEPLTPLSWLPPKNTLWIMRNHWIEMTLAHISVLRGTQRPFSAPFQRELIQVRQLVAFPHRSTRCPHRSTLYCHWNLGENSLLSLGIWEESIGWLRNKKISKHQRREGTLCGQGVDMKFTSVLNKYWKLSKLLFET